MQKVLTCGVFDCLHEGHKNLLDEMMKLGEVHVLLHDDYSTFKNKNRFPVQTYKHRKRNLLKYGVKKVYKCTTPTPDFRKFVKKNFLYVRGNDWINFPGKEMLDANKIPIKFLPYTEGISTSIIRTFIKL